MTLTNDTESPTNRDSNLLTLAMIVRDGGQYLAPLLAGAHKWVDEIVIGDTGSCDDSVAIARRYGARVHHISWDDDFASARNKVLDQCSGAWILVLDADETLSENDWRELREWVTSRQAENWAQAGSIATRNYVHGRYGNRGWTPVPDNDPHGLPSGAPTAGYVTTTKVRLFPNRTEIRFRGQLHETVEASLWDAHIPVVDLPWPVHHFGYLEANDEKNERYLHLANLKTTEQPHDARAWAELADCAVSMNDYTRALVAIDRSLVLDPTNADRRLTAGWLLKETGDLTRAEEQLATVSGTPEVDPHLLAEASHLRAQIAIESERAATAAPLLALAVRLFPDNGHFQNTLGTLNLILGRGDAAKRALVRACDLLPDQAEPCLNLAVLMEAAGRPEQANEHYAEALRRAPDNEQAATGLKKTTLDPVFG